MGISSEPEVSHHLCLHLNPQELSICLKEGLHKCKLKEAIGSANISCAFSTGYVDPWRTYYDYKNSEKCLMFTSDIILAERMYSAAKGLREY